MDIFLNYIKQASWQGLIETALRIALVGAMMFGMCVWSVYDGKVGWPGKNRVMAA